MRKLTLKGICLLLALLVTASVLMAGCGQEQPDNGSTGIPADSSTGDPADTTQTDPPENTDPQESLEEIFNNAAFIGDSVTVKLRNYNTQHGVLGTATFLCQGSYSVDHAVNNTMLLSFRGQDMTPQDALKECGASRVFILLGMNDIALNGVEATIGSWKILVDNIRQVNPDIEIYIQSGTPIHKDGEVGDLTNERMDEYNAQLKVFAEANGCHYVDIATRFKNSSNALAEGYCSDGFVHFTDVACQMWADMLKAAVQQ